MEIGSLLFMLGLAYALGLFWYDLVPRKVPAQVWRVAAYPFLGIFVAESLLPMVFTADPRFGGIHLFTAFIGSLAGVIADWVITEARRPAVVATLEPRAA